MSDSKKNIRQNLRDEVVKVPIAIGSSRVFVAIYQLLFIQYLASLLYITFHAHQTRHQFDHWTQKRLWKVRQAFSMWERASPLTFRRSSGRVNIEIRFLSYLTSLCWWWLCRPCSRVAELGSHSSGAKMAMKIFVKRVFTIFASNALFLRVIANLQNLLNMQYIPCNSALLAQETLFLTQKGTFFLPKISKNRNKS